MEFWLSTAIMAIAMEAGKPLAVDDFTKLLQKTSYARICVEIDAGMPLKSGVLIKGKGMYFGNSLYMRTYLSSATIVEGWGMLTRDIDSLKESFPQTIVTAFTLKELHGGGG